MRSTMRCALFFIHLLVSSIATAVTVASFPNTEIVLDMARLSYAVYHLRKKVSSCDSLIYNDTTKNGTQQELPSDVFKRLLPNETSCLYYNHDYSLGRQVLIVRNTAKNYVAVAYAGTDDWRTALSDGEILTEAFGPRPADNNTNVPSIGGKHGGNISSIFDSVPSKVRVHSGFNNDVFANAGFSTVLQCVSSGRHGGNCDGKKTDNNIQTTQPYRLYTTGHSLGAASSVILGAALHLTYPSEKIQSVNFGCPKQGNLEWSAWIDTLQPNYNPSHPGSGLVDHRGTFEMFRFVNKIDLVPRLPDPLYFQHAGHTLQMSTGGNVKAYYDHIGNGDLDFAGVPYGWGAAPYVFLPGAIASHMCTHYLDYLHDYLPNTTSYVVNFELVDNNTRSDDEINPPDDKAYSIE
uniref:Fungal lipase-type domain-containing protein n=1 Tax=Skeletonema marinoi TaxID=267567 RepID=A0A7S2PYQ6_9STRA|mmetsp:Transcript_4579/g.7872  ORF Transcript_4579/g.7872 Transcript_4579/m.7872 type:complete len:406 (+) Transcript_4579:126-1343(+)